MHKSNKYLYLLLVLPLLMYFTLSLTSCDPHRSGSVIKGPSAKNKRHHRPASAKRHRKNKY